MHYTYMNPVVSSYAFGWFFGSLLPVCLESHHQQRCHHISQTVSTIIDVKSSSGLDRLGGGLVIRRVGNGSEFCLCTYNYQFPSERNFLQGPWIGFKTPEKAVGSYGWVGVIITRIRRRIIGCLLIDLLLSLLYFV